MWFSSIDEPQQNNKIEKGNVFFLQVTHLYDDVSVFKQPSLLPGARFVVFADLKLKRLVSIHQSIIQVPHGFKHFDARKYLYFDSKLIGIIVTRYHMQYACYMPCQLPKPLYFCVSMIFIWLMVNKSIRQVDDNCFLQKRFLLIENVEIFCMQIKPSKWNGEWAPSAISFEIKCLGKLIFFQKPKNNKFIF